MRASTVNAIAKTRFNGSLRAIEFKLEWYILGQTRLTSYHFHMVKWQWGSLCAKNGIMNLKGASSCNLLKHLLSRNIVTVARNLKCNLHTNSSAIIVNEYVMYAGDEEHESITIRGGARRIPKIYLINRIGVFSSEGR